MMFPLIVSILCPFPSQDGWQAAGPHRAMRGREWPANRPRTKPASAAGEAGEEAPQHEGMG